MPDTQKPNANAIQFQLIAITTEQFATFMEKFDKAVTIESFPTVRFVSSKERRAVGVFTRIEHQQKGEPFVVLEVGTHFQFTEPGWKALQQGQEEGKIRIPNVIVTHLAFLAMGTLRGVQYEKTLGLDCGKMILPLINLQDNLTEDIIL